MINEIRCTVPLTCSTWTIASKLLLEVAGGGDDVEVMNALATQFAVRVQCAFLGWPGSLHETLIRWTANHHEAMHHLAEHGDHQAMLRRDHSLLPSAIDEILRVHNPLHGNRRMTTCPVKLNDRLIGAGERVYINWIAANRDETVFEQADQVKLGRDSKDNLLYVPASMSAPAAPLARLEMRVMIEESFAMSSGFQLQPDRTVVLDSYPGSGFSSVPIRFQWAGRG